ncbi:hypothetical protein QBA35_13190 [Streptomyces bottropensis]|uniref:Uncharacterized protein n=1 Tax=Streptomyces bottropensis TaxID=42235 RepID=A0ABU8AKW6_9ACTN
MLRASSRGRRRAVRGAGHPAEETAAWQLAGRIYGWWLLGGLVLFPVLGLTRALVVHLATMIATPPALFTLVVLGAVR